MRRRKALRSDWLWRWAGRQGGCNAEWGGGREHEEHGGLNVFEKVKPVLQQEAGEAEEQQRQRQQNAARLRVHDSCEIGLE